MEAKMAKPTLTCRGEADAAAAAAAQTQAAIQHMMALTSCPPGTAVVPFKINESNKAGRMECYPDKPNPHWLTVMKHLDSKDGEQPGILMFNMKGTVHRAKKVPHSLFELQTKAGPGQTELVKEAKIPDGMLAAPPWQLRHLRGLAVFRV